jgi:DNA-binding MarR family transcriptional regulator/GNAT superfamily N-acetyltransferase
MALATDTDRTDTDVDADRIAAVRAFTRFYTSIIGVLDEGLLHTPFSVAEARVIYELAQRDEMGIADLRRELRIDAGYMSRITARLEADGLIARRRDPGDARRQVLRLAGPGRRVFADLDRRSSEQVAGLLSGLDEATQRAVIAAMDTVRAAFAGPTDTQAAPAVVLRPPRAGDFGWVVARHGALYAAEYGWDASFEALVARIVADYVDAGDTGRQAAWIAEVDGEPVGCVFCVARDDTTAQLRILLVEPTARGLGIGRRLVDECLRFARSAGYRSIVLWTNDVLVSARRIYEAAGFALVEEERHHSFGRDLVGQYWARDL